MSMHVHVILLCSLLLLLCPSPASAPASLAVVAHARSTPVHVAHNSWSDTVRLQGPHAEEGYRRWGFQRPAVYGGRLQVHFPGGNQAQVPGRSGEVRSHLPSTRRFLVSNSCHLDMDMRQSMCWTKVCGTAQSGIWVLKGNARTCMFPANLDHLRVGWKKQGSYKTAWVTPGQVCLCSYKYGHGAAVRPQTNKAIWDGVISLWCRVAPFLSPWCDKRELPTGVNLNHYDGSRSCVRWHSDNESLFGPRDSPKLIVSLSLGNPVEFKVRRVSDSVPSSIRLDHGDILVMDGLAQSEYEHCTASELQGPRVNLTYRWVAQPHCVLSTSRRSGLCVPNVCARFGRAKLPLVGRRGK